MTIAKLSDGKLEIKDDKGRICTGQFFPDGSGKASPSWILDRARKDLGSRRVTTAIQQAMTTGSAEVL
jgi:hypothetical protein